jgi:hypothetical protein
MVVLAALMLVAMAPRAEAQTQTQTLPLKITQVALVNGQFTALGTLGTQPFKAPVTLATSPSGNPACPILDLQLGPINLNLLGLVVQTSPICLDVMAQPGSGNLLGNLLCQVARLLDRGVSLNQVLRTLGPIRLQKLLAGLTGLLQGALNEVTSASAVTATPDANGCPILNLTLGPVQLNLLGLVVNLDNCSGGPVTVNLSAVSGTGNLLGNLLCSLTGLLDNPQAILQQIITAIGAL